MAELHAQHDGNRLSERGFGRESEKQRGLPFDDCNDCRKDVHNYAEWALIAFRVEFISPTGKLKGGVVLQPLPFLLGRLKLLTGNHVGL